MFLIFTILTLGLLIIYLALLSAFVLGWNKRVAQTTPSQRKSSIPPTITVLVACRNEAKNLPLLLESFILQELQANEFIFIDDHSTDGTLEILRNFAAKQSNVSVLKSEGEGKKQALRQAILAAKSEVILCTDADCAVPRMWVQKVLAEWLRTPFDLLILPVEIVGDNCLFARLQHMEFATLVASGGSAANLGHAIMCNGANLAFRKSAWLECSHELHDELHTGDDVFLLHALKRRSAAIRFLSEKEVCVQTQACATLTEFFAQRARWASKASAYTDMDTIAVACVVFGVNVWLLVLLFGMFFSRMLLPLLLVLFVAKWIADVIFLMHMRTLFVIKNLLLNSFLLSLIYPFYVCVSVFKSQKIKH